jgi:hypothetical protein
LAGGKSINSKKVRRGDIVEVEWSDTHSVERILPGEIEEIDGPGPTVAYGVVLRNGRQHLTIASEICLDQESDGNWIEQIPHCTIRRARVLGKRTLPEQ